MESLSSNTKRRIEWTAILLFFVLSLYWIYNTLGIAADLLLLALAAAYLVRPLVVGLEKRGVSRIYAVSSTILLSTTLCVIGIYFFVPLLYAQLSELLISSPEILKNVLIKAREFATHYNLPITINEERILEMVKEHLSNNLEGSLKPLFETTKAIIFSGIGFLLLVVNIFLFPLFFYYLTKEYEDLGAAVWRLIPPRFHLKAKYYIERIDLVLSGFVRGQLLDCTFLALMYGTGLFFSGTKFGAVIGVISGYLSIIPYVGTGIGIIVATLVALAYQADLMQYVGIALTFSIGQLIESFFIQPHIVGNRVGLGPLPTMLVVIAGGNMGGLMGMLVAIPIAGILKVVIADLVAAYRRSQLYLG